MKSRNKRDLEKHWAEHTKMSATHGRVPKKGDRVGANGHTGEFTIVEVRRIPKVVDLQALKGGTTEKNIPWTSLIFLDKEGSSPAAAPAAKETPEEEQQ
jgi:hypothetical protein